MLQNKYFKIFIWFISTAFFVLATVIVVAALGPGPSENQIMQFMMGMMNAMHSSLMSFSMGLEEDKTILTLIDASSSVLIPLIVVAVFGGIFIRIRRHG